MYKATACWHLSQHTSSLQEAVILPNEQQNCLIRSLYSLVSTGTERLVASGKVPPAVYTEMQVPYMEGSFSFPVKYGYSLVGRVEEGPASLLHRTVHLLHPHQDLCFVNPQDVFVVPDQIPPQRAILASNLETALNAVWDAQVSIGDSVVVVGFGIIGSLTARLLQLLPAVQVAVLELDPTRSRLAEAMGFTLANPEEDHFDIAFHTSGSAEGLQACLDKVGAEGKVIEVSWYGDQPVTLQLGGSFHHGRKQLISSQVSHLPVHRLARWDFIRRKAVVFELLKLPVFDQHITKTIPFQELPTLFDALRTGSLSELCWSVAYPEKEVKTI